MKRDMDLVRDLLLAIENEPQYDGMRWFGIDNPAQLRVEGHSQEEVIYHLKLLIEAGLVKGRVSPDASSVAVNRLTWEGHEFASNIHDPKIWKETKERLKGLPGVAISVLAELAKAEIKKAGGPPFLAICIRGSTIHDIPARIIPLDPSSDSCPSFCG